MKKSTLYQRHIFYILKDERR